MTGKKTLRMIGFAAEVFSEASAIAVFAAGAILFSQVVLADNRMAAKQERIAFIHACTGQGNGKANCVKIYRLAALR